MPKRAFRDDSNFGDDAPRPLKRLKWVDPLNFDVPSECKTEAERIYSHLLCMKSVDGFAKAILQLIAEYSVSVHSNCEVCGFQVIANLDPNCWQSTKISSHQPTQWFLLPRELSECVWTTTDDIDRWYLLNLNTVGIHGRFPRRERYQSLPLANNHQIICGPCVQRCRKKWQNRQTNRSEQTKTV